MCGIVGSTTVEPVASELVEKLAKLEYRGYDSAGVALVEAHYLTTMHRVGKVAKLAADVSELASQACCGIGHTRWATHGRPSEANAHPHTSCDGRIAVVHNGIIENFAELKTRLVQDGHQFSSETDTEVIAHLIEEAYQDTQSLLAATELATRQLVGAYAIAVVCADEPTTIIAARKDSPLILAHNGQKSVLASDLLAVLDVSRDVIVLPDHTFARLTPGSIELFDDQLIPTEMAATHIDWSIETAEKGGYPDFMLKEICEQPRVIRDTLAGRMAGGALQIDELGLSREELSLVDRVYVIACGTSYHAGLIAKNIIERWARIPVEVAAASEFRYANPIITSSTLVVAVSQSGETADTLAAIRDARIKGAKVFGITNVVGSPVARESDGVIYTKANKEISVASTKSFTGQVASLTLLALLLAQVKGKLTVAQVHMLFKELADTATDLERMLSVWTSETDQLEGSITAAAHAFAETNSALYLGRGIASAICYEGALKLKEISYVHAEAYAAGEMKHGPIALVQPGFPVVAVVTDSPTYEKTISNLKECEARGATIIAIASEGNEEITELADYVIYVPKTREVFTPITTAIPLQLLARAVAVMRGCDVDRPRNLAKSVTVE